jgi:hypothetical protein
LANCDDFKFCGMWPWLHCCLMMCVCAWHQVVNHTLVDDCKKNMLRTWLHGPKSHHYQNINRPQWTRRSIAYVFTVWYPKMGQFHKNQSPLKRIMWYSTHQCTIHWIPLKTQLLRFHLQDIKHPIQTMQLSVCKVLHILISIITLVVLHVLHVLKLLTTFKLTTIQETGQVSIGNLVPSVRLLWHSSLFDLFVTPQLFKPCDRTMQVPCRAPHWHWQIWLEGVFSILYFTLVKFYSKVLQETSQCIWKVP